MLFQAASVGYSRTKNGYVYVKVSPARWEYEHRFVIESIVGRRLGRTETVHHRDHNTLNNDPGNLVIVDASEHGRLHYGEAAVESIARV